MSGRLTESGEFYIEQMLQRFAEADDLGIERRFVPEWILSALQERGYVTKIEATPRITEAGRLALREQGDV